MKKYFLLAAAAATVLAVSCNKEKNQPKVDPTPGTEIEDNTPQPIRFGTNIAEVKAPITKAAIEDHGWNGEDLFIYAFGTAANGSVDVDDLLIGSATAGAPAKAPLASSTPSGNRDAITLEKDATTHEPYYYTVGKVYNFFGYYVGDAALGAMANYQLPITIDGTNDIMVATTDKIADYMDAAASVSLDKVYSDVSARDNVVPDLMFKHQLSRFVFKTKYAGTGTYTDVAFKSLTLKSYNQGTLTVAAADPNAIGFIANSNEARADLALAGFTPYTNTTDFAAAAHPGDGQFVKLGESILAVPEGDNTNHAKYNATLTIGQINTATTPASIQEQPYNFVIDFEKIEDPTTHQPIAHAWAEPGKQYTVNIQVYGFEKIKITVSLENWGEGGETEIDPDLDEREAVTIVAALNEASIVAGSTTNVTVTSAVTATSANDVAAYVQYSSSNTRVATVSGTGEVTGVNPGNCKIYVVVPGTATYQSGFVALDLTVNAPAAADPAVEITCANVDMTIGGAVATLAPTFSANYAGTVTYSTNAPAGVFTIDGNSGVITWGGSPADGDYTVTINAAADATNHFAANTKDVTVTVNPIVTTLAGVPSNQSITTAAGTYQISGVTVQAGGADLNPQPTITYESSDNSVATVTGTGLVTAAGNGVATIKIKYEGSTTYKSVEDSFQVTVSGQ